MGDFSKNPKTPFVVQVPNKIRKWITMHEKEAKSNIVLTSVNNTIQRASLLLRVIDQKKPRKRGSLWSRFTRGVANFFNIKPEIRK